MRVVDTCICRACAGTRRDMHADAGWVELGAVRDKKIICAVYCIQCM